MSVILHFGMPKTGMVSIQRTLQEVLKTQESDITLISSRNGDADRLIDLTFGDKPTEILARYRIPPRDFPREKAKTTERFAKLISDHGDGSSPILISSNRIAHLSEAALLRLRKHLDNEGLAVELGAYIRPPKPYVESAFQEEIRSNAHRFSVSSLVPAYKKMYERLERVFGRENINYWLYNPHDFPKACVVRDFADKLGLDIAEADNIYRLNTSLPFPALSLLYAYRKHGASFGAEVQSAGNMRLLQRLHELPSTRFYLHSKLIAPALEKQMAEIRWMEERLGTSLTANLAEHDDRAIRSEEDLLRAPRQALEWLAQNLTDKNSAQGVLSGDAKLVAKGMHEFSSSLTGDELKQSRKEIRSAARSRGARPERVRKKRG